MASLSCNEDPTFKMSAIFATLDDVITLNGWSSLFESTFSSCEVSSPTPRARCELFYIACTRKKYFYKISDLS